MKPKKHYHHGNLKRALLDAALELTRAVGSEGFTLRQVAARAGVSHTALYRHFRNKDDLLAAVATEGYKHLMDSHMQAIVSAKTASERYRLEGRSFVEFAIRYPEHFKTIFDAPRRYEYPETLEAGERSFNLLIRTIEECQAEGSMIEINPRMLAFVALAIVIGLAKLATTDRLPFATVDEKLAFCKKSIDLLTDGLAPRPVVDQGEGKDAAKKKSVEKPAKREKARPKR